MPKPPITRLLHTVGERDLGKIFGVEDRRIFQTGDLVWIESEEEFSARTVKRGWWAAQHHARRYPERAKAGRAVASARRKAVVQDVINRSKT